MVKRSRSTLMLLEQIIVIAVFAFCAAVCINIIASSYLMTAHAIETRNALTVAESAAEVFKAGGDADQVFGMVGTYFDENWQQIDRANSFFALRISTLDGQGIVYADIWVGHTNSDDALVRLMVAARRSVHE